MSYLPHIPLRISYSGGVTRLRVSSDTGKLEPSGLLQAAMFASERLYRTARDYPHLTWREVGKRHRIGLPSSGPIPRVDPNYWRTPEGARASSARQAYYAVPAAIRRAVQSHCERQGHPFPFRKR